VNRTLDQIIECREMLAAICDDNGPEHISQPLLNLANKHLGMLIHIQNGKLNQNAYIERFNRTALHEWQGYISSIAFHMLDC